jgi:hypothetical protein
VIWESKDSPAATPLRGDRDRVRSTLHHALAHRKRSAVDAPPIPP